MTCQPRFFAFAGRSSGCEWSETHRYLNMDYLREFKKEALRNAA